MALFNADNRSNRIDNRISHSKSFGVYGRGATVNGNVGRYYLWKRFMANK